MENIVKQEKPDFIAFTGDMVAGLSILLRVMFRIQLGQDEGMVREDVEPLDHCYPRFKGSLRLHPW